MINFNFQGFYGRLFLVREMLVFLRGNSCLKVFNWDIMICLFNWPSLFWACLWHSSLRTLVLDKDLVLNIMIWTTILS